MDLFDIAVAKKLAGGGGGGGGITPIVEKTYNVSTTSTTAIDIDTFQIPLTDITNKWLLTIIEDTNGPKEGYFYAWQNARFNGVGLGGNYYKNTTASAFATAANGKYGVYASLTQDTSGNENFVISAKYDSSKTGTIDGTFKVRIFIF